MSIVGTESVSMSDLMKLGPQTLNAMAQGQMQSIAPSYMVIAALKSLTDQQKAQQQPMPGGTVKDQVIQQSMPPQQAGIGSMAPQQMFAEGGSVQPTTQELNDRILDYFRPWWERTKEETRRGLASHRRTLDEINYGNEGRGQEWAPLRNMGVIPTAPTAAQVAQYPKAEFSNEGRNAPVREDVPTPPFAATRSVDRGGIRSAGGSPTDKYKFGPDNVKRPDLNSVSVPKMPENTYLDEALAKYSKPNEARLAELRQSEKMAGLGAFAEGILQGRGLGGALGPAAAAAARAMEERADKRRAFEDNWDSIARDLGLKKGTDEYNRARDKYDMQRTEQAAQYQESVRGQQRADDITAKQIDFQLRGQQIAAQFAQIREAAAARRDNRLLAQVNQVQSDYERARTNVQKEVTERYSKLPTYGMDPELQRRAASEVSQQLASLEQRYLPRVEALMKQMGVPDK